MFSHIIFHCALPRHSQVLCALWVVGDVHLCPHHLPAGQPHQRRRLPPPSPPSTIPDYELNHLTTSRSLGKKKLSFSES